MNRMEGKVTLVSGAASGIGQAAAKRLASEGGSVFCVDINEAVLKETVAEITQAGGTASYAVCNVGDESQVQATIAACIAEYGQLDAICNMAGILRFDHFHEIKLEDWKRVIDINLTGTFLMCKEALPHLIESNGAIINAASTASLAGLPWGAAYAASKGGVQAMTRSIAVSYASQGVRANCICPGDIETNMANQVVFPENADMNLLGRIMSLTGMKGPEVVTGLIAMLASDDGIHITGEEIRVDGGMLT